MSAMLCILATAYLPHKHRLRRDCTVVGVKILPVYMNNVHVLAFCWICAETGGLCHLGRQTGCCQQRRQYHRKSYRHTYVFILAQPSCKEVRVCSGFLLGSASISMSKKTGDPGVHYPLLPGMTSMDLAHSRTRSQGTRKKYAPSSGWRMCTPWTHGQLPGPVWLAARC